MELIITLPDAKAADILRHFAKSAGYKSFVQDPADPDNPIPNPVSHEDFSKATLKNVILQNAKNDYVIKQEKAARAVLDTDANTKLDF